MNKTNYILLGLILNIQSVTLTQEIYKREFMQNTHALYPKLDAQTQKEIEKFHGSFLMKHIINYEHEKQFKTILQDFLETKDATKLIDYFRKDMKNKEQHPVQLIHIIIAEDPHDKIKINTLIACAQFLEEQNASIFFNLWQFCKRNSKTLIITSMLIVAGTGVMKYWPNYTVSDHHQVTNDINTPNNRFDGYDRKLDVRDFQIDDDIDKIRINNPNQATLQDASTFQYSRSKPRNEFHTSSAIINNIKNITEASFISTYNLGAKSIMYGLLSTANAVPEPIQSNCPIASVSTTLSQLAQNNVWAPFTHNHWFFQFMACASAPEVEPNIITHPITVSYNGTKWTLIYNGNKILFQGISLITVIKDYKGSIKATFTIFKGPNEPRTLTNSSFDNTQFIFVKEYILNSDITRINVYAILHKLTNKIIGIAFRDNNTGQIITVFNPLYF